MKVTRQLIACLFVLISIACPNLLLAQPAPTHAAIDFGRDVQPLFRTHCIDCHGPNQQENSFRLDRRADAMNGGTGAMIGAGDSEASRLYHKLVGNAFGPQMPPDGPLTSEEIDIVRRRVPLALPVSWRFDRLRNG